MYFWGRWIAIASASSWTLCCEGADHQVQLTPAQQAELEPRFTALDHDRTQSVTWVTPKAELEQRCP
jgi:hypothetical protein